MSLAKVISHGATCMIIFITGLLHSKKELSLTLKVSKSDFDIDFFFTIKNVRILRLKEGNKSFLKYSCFVLFIIWLFTIKVEGMNKSFEGQESHYIAINYEKKS